MNLQRLERHLTDMILEAQLKMGYESNTMLLNYTFASIKNITDCDCDIEQMKKMLDEFADTVEAKYGHIEITQTGSMFCFKIPAQGAVYVHENIQATDFLKDFIKILSVRGAGAEEIIAVFKKYSSNVHVQKVTNGEFDYLVYFEDGIPDDYYYCLTDEGLCITYH